MKYKCFVAVFIFLLIFSNGLIAQGNSNDTTRKILKKQLSLAITRNIDQISKACNNSFYYLIYNVDSNLSVNINLIGTDSTVKSILLKSSFKELNNYVIDYINSIGVKNVSVIQPFYIGCIESKTWVDMTDLVPLFYKIDKFPGSKILMDFLEFDMIH